MASLGAHRRSNFHLLVILFSLLVSSVCSQRQKIIYAQNAPVFDPRPTASPAPTAQNRSPTPASSPASLIPTDNNSNSNSKSTSRSTIGIAVGVTAAVTFLLSFALFLLCQRFGKFRRDTDSKPLLGFFNHNHTDTDTKNRFGGRNTNVQYDPEKHGSANLPPPPGRRSNGGLSRFGRSKNNDGMMETERLRSEQFSSSDGRFNNQMPNGSAIPMVNMPLRPPAPQRDASKSHRRPPRAPSSAAGGAPPAPASAPAAAAGRPPPPPPPPPPPVPSGGARPPPPPLPAAPRPPPFGAGKTHGKPALPANPLRPGVGAGSSSASSENMPLKLKPLHWDKFKAVSEHSMVWDRVNQGSFRVDEEMMESLFGYDLKKAVEKEGEKPPSAPELILDRRKSQNFAIMLRALDVKIEEVCDALKEGDGLNIEFLEKVVKFTLTKEEEIKLRGYNGDTSKLGSAERFLKQLLNIPFCFRRFDAMLFKATFEDEIEFIKESLVTLETACTELKEGRLFLKLLEAVLKTGNRMNAGTNRGNAQAFNLNALLRLADVKGTDGKTTLLHFVVQEITRWEGKRLALAQDKTNQASDSVDAVDEPSIKRDREYMKLGFEAVSGISNELQNVKNAAGIDSSILTGFISKLATGLAKTRELLRDLSGSGKQVAGLVFLPDDEFSKAMGPFVEVAGAKLQAIQAEEERVFTRVKRITEYYHAKALGEKSDLLNIFVIVNDFLRMLDGVCVEIGNSLKKSNAPKTDTKAIPKESPPNSFRSLSKMLFPNAYRKMFDSSDESSSD